MAGGRKGEGKVLAQKHRNTHTHYYDGVIADHVSQLISPDPSVISRLRRRSKRMLCFWYRQKKMRKQNG